MMLAKSLLFSTVAGFAAIAGAQAADLPSRKAAPVNYVKICDAYGAGFFYIPGTDTCLRVGGYVRAEWQYSQGRRTYTFIPANTVVGFQTPSQVPGSFNTAGTEVRGRVDLDARTPTAMGTVRTMVQLRAANTSGIRNTNPANNANWTLSSASATSITAERAFVQWAGFTFGIAPENYAMMPSQAYLGNPWTGFPNGMKQLAYTATFGGGFSATLAIEDRTDFAYAPVYSHTPTNGYHLVGNVRVDQSWGFAAIHGMIGNNSLRSDYQINGIGNGVLTGAGTNTTNNALIGSRTVGGYAIGATVKLNLPMIAAGDAVWLTANYTKGLLGSLLSNGSLQNLSTSSGRRVAGGITRIDAPLMITSGNCLVTCTVDSVTGWNVAMAATHYWTPQWRSNFSAGYIEITPPTVSGPGTLNPVTSPFQWGKGRVWEVMGSLVYSPAKDFDIGLELQYLNVKSRIQNATLANLPNFINAGSPGLSSNGWSTKLRVERQF